MSNTKSYYYTLQDIEKLEQEKATLRQAYDAAVENDLPFNETKQIFLRLKEIKQELENLHEKMGDNQQTAV